MLLKKVVNVYLMSMLNGIFGRLGYVIPDCHMYRGGALPPKSLYSIYTAQGAQCNKSTIIRILLSYMASDA